MKGESRRRPTAKNTTSQVTEYSASTPLGWAARDAVARSLGGRRRSAARRTPSLGGRGGRRPRRRVLLARPASYGLAWRSGWRRARVLTPAEAPGKLEEGKKVRTCE